MKYLIRRIINSLMPKRNRKRTKVAEFYRNRQQVGKMTSIRDYRG